MCVLITYLVIILVIFAETDAGRRQQRPKTRHIDIQTDLGMLRGITAVSSKGREYIRFRGIPYGQPPVGALRFKDPVEYTNRWENVTFVAKDYQRGCVSYDNYYIVQKSTYVREYRTAGIEDCLFINVHTRTIDPNATITPVIFFIHGGAFSFGGPADYDTSKIMDRDVVFVNFAYRVGIMGFLSTGDSVVPGNMGLKDQLLALQWVHKQIWRFGGDKTRISIQGVGAGAASVHFMYLSPLTRGLFHNGYSYSGTALCPWAMLENVQSRTKEIANYMKCPIESTQAMVDCLRETNAYDLVNATSRAQVFFYNPFTIFTPVVDIASPRPYLPQTAKQLLVQGKFHHLPWITGFTAEDGLYPAAEFLYNDNQMAQLSYNWDDYLPALLFYKRDCPGSIGTKVLEALRTYAENYERFFKSALLQLMTEHLYSLPAHQSAAYMSQRSFTKTYVYKFMYSSSVTYAEHLFKSDKPDGWSVGHRDDITYLYDKDFAVRRKRPRDLEMAEELLNLATTFANYSHFPETFTMWEPSKSNFSVYNFLEITGPYEYYMNEVVGAASEEFLDIISNLANICD